MTKIKLNILFLIGKYPNYGGAEIVTTILSNAFSQKGFKIYIASFEQPVKELLCDLNSSVGVIPLSYPVYSKKNILVEKEINVIINQWCLPFYVTLLCKKAMYKLDCRLIAVHHNDPSKNARITEVEITLSKLALTFIKKQLYYSKLYFLKRLTRISMRYVYTNSDQYILLSKSFIKIFKDFTRLKKIEKIEIITNPITVTQTQNLNKNIPKEKLFIYVGRIDYNQKRVERVVKIWEEINAKYPEYRLIIVGDGPEKLKLENIVQTKKIERISFVGFKNPVRFYEKAMFLLLTSEYEGFPLVIAEAMYYGVVPIVYGSYPAVYDIIDQYKNGVIVKPPYNIEAFCKEIDKLLSKEAAVINMQIAAIEKVKNFEIEIIIDKWLNLFNSKLLINEKCS